MILSHEHKFIFLKTTKTAGTSIEIALSEFCGPRDVITPVSPEDEELRASLGYRGPQNYFAPVWEYRRRDILKWKRKRAKKRKFFNHISAADVRAAVGDRIWNSYYKFCVTRNPWDRMVSLFYWWHRNDDPKPPFSEFVASRAPEKLMKKGWELYTIDDEIAVDCVCRYEHLSEDLEEVRGRIGLPKPLSLPRAKSSHRADKRSYKELIHPDDGEYIREYFQKEIDAFGYDF
jgi:hypothetical protein